MKQPLLGLVTLFLVIIITLGIVSLFEETTFSTWVAFLFMCCVPAQIVFALVWHCSLPAAANNMTQPLKGIFLTVLTAITGMALAILTYYLVGKGHGVTPMLLMYTILSVVVTFWYAVLWQCWPVTLFSKNPLIIGSSVLLVAYFGAYVIFEIFFNFAFLQGTPVYFPDADPGGLFMAWIPMSFLITTVAMILTLVLFDFWPVAGISNPCLKVLSATVIVMILACIIYYLAISVAGMDRIRYMALVPVSYIFGIFLPLNLLQGTLFTQLKQPVKGLALAIFCAFAALFLQEIYLLLGPVVSGPLAAGPAGNYQEELWLSSALLGLTFPVLVIMTDYLDFWPMNKQGHPS